MTKINADLFLRIFEGLVQDFADIMGVERSTFMGDFEMISRCLKSRGVKVIFLDLPALCKAFDKAVDRGEWSEEHGKGVPFCRKGRPILFKSLLHRIFDRNWVVSREADTMAIFCFRQACRLFKKYRIECPQETLKEKIREFIQIEETLPKPRLSWGEDDLLRVGAYPNLIDLGFAATGFDYSSESLAGTPVLSYGLFRALVEIQKTADNLLKGYRFNRAWFKPKHGPGAVSEPYENSKYEFPTWPVRLESFFPFAEYGLVNYTYADGKPFDETKCSSCKLIDVPKDYKGPRLIASEPISAQYVQQGLMSVLRQNTSKSILRHSVDFRSQEPSRKMALSASVDGSFSTIDLSSASDRLSCALVECIFRRNFVFLEILNSARTPEVRLPDGSVLRMKKFAAQGAAFTFPVQSIVYAIICIGVVKSLNFGMTTTEAAKLVRVYGDDMIVPRYAFDLVCEVVNALYLEVNRDKSFNDGLFRESCGMDAYRGDDVTPASILTFFDKVSPSTLVSVVDASNNLYKKGLVRASAALLETIPKDKLLNLAGVDSTSTVFGLLGPRNPRLKRRWNSLLHRYETRILTVESKVRKSLPDGHSRLMQWFIENPAQEIRWIPGEVKGVKARCRLRWVPDYLIREG